MKGKLIVIDGADGVGKTTQVWLLVKRLRKEGYKVATLDFPVYKSFFGQMISDYLKDERVSDENAGPYFASMLYSLDRWKESLKIHKWLSQGKIVILDRYTPANQIHQGARILNKAKQEEFFLWLSKLEFAILKVPKPNLVIFLYLPTALSYALIKKRGRKKDIHEKSLKHQKRALELGLKLAKKEGWSMVHCFKEKKILSREKIAELIFQEARKII